jgi:hypothetical protein
MHRLRICQVFFVFVLFVKLCVSVCNVKSLFHEWNFLCMSYVCMSMMRAQEGPKHVVDCNGMQWRCSGTTNKRMLLCSWNTATVWSGRGTGSFSRTLPRGVSCKQDAFAFHPKRGSTFNRLEPKQFSQLISRASLICLWQLRWFMTQAIIA